MEDAWCYETLRRCRWPEGVTCPRCGLKRVTAHTRLPGTPRIRYLCLHCRRTFTDLTGTPLARTNLPLGTWFLCLRLLGRGRSTSRLAKDLKVKWDTAVYMQRRLARGLGRPGLIRQLRKLMEKSEAASASMGMPRGSLRTAGAYGTRRKGKERWPEAQ